jgi:hypothetical protein
MEHLIREFGAWLKQGCGWLVDVIVFGCLWGISQASPISHECCLACVTHAVGH